MLKIITNKFFLVGLGIILIIIVSFTLVYYEKIDLTDLKKVIDWLIITRFLIVTLSVSVIFGMGFLIAKYVAHNRSQFLTKKVKLTTDIREDLKKGLIIKKADDQSRLSQFEIESINNLFKSAVNKEVKKNLEIISYHFLLWYLFSFFMSGIIFFIVIIVGLFHQPALQAILLYIFQGKCP